MKAVILLLTFFLPCLVFSIEPGQTKTAVLSELGQPSGVMEMQGKQWLLYPRGKVVLVGGVVESAALISQEELDARRLFETEERQRLARLARERRQQRIVDGGIAKAEILSDPGYYYQTAEQRYNTWKAFREQFPETDTREEWIASLEAMEEERKEEELNRQIANLQDRVRRAENQVQQQQVQRTRYSYPYMVSYPRYSSAYSRPVQPCALPASRISQNGIGISASAQQNSLAATLRFQSMTPVRMMPVRMRAAHVSVQ